MLVVQLALLIFLIRYFELGSSSFGTIALLALPAFLVHSLLPLQHRLLFFLCTSMAGILLVLGPVSGLWLFIIVTAFIAICHLPWPLSWRVAGLVSAGAGLALFRANGWGVPWSDTAWPIIASILMFRLIIYLYDVHHEKDRSPIAWRLSYFFLLPNVCFPLFPVVDYKKFRTSYYSEPAPVVYERGLQWMFRGIYQLMLYRLVYQFMVIPPNEVLSTAQLLQFILSSYLLYLRVSGLFHLIVGMLLLFGFNLPETHKKYYFASSFNDFWRRINIYWKDFMMKIFYYPVYFKTKHLGATPALIIATVTVFLATWTLHAYQWFWLRGTVLLELHDLLFWAILGALVVVNSLSEIRHGRDRAAGKRPLFSYAWFANAFRVLATFSTIGILWSMWSSDSLEQWLLMWRSAGLSSALVPLAVPAFYLLARWAERQVGVDKPARRRIDPRAITAADRSGSWLISGIMIFGLGALVAATRPEVRLLPEGYEEAAGRLRTAQLNRRDQARMERGYYEHLLNVNRHSEGLWAAMEKKPADWTENLDSTEIAQRVSNFLITELEPQMQITFKEATLATNRWGMRDAEYELAKPPDCLRIALLGTSHTLGSGVDNDEVFEHLLEQRLNSSAVTAGTRFEVLNFAMVAYSALQQLYLLEQKVRRFEPDVVIYFTLEDDERFILRHLSLAIRRSITIPYPPVEAVVQNLSLDTRSSDEEIRRKLAPYAPKMQAWAERRLADQIRKMGADPVNVFLPKVQSRPDHATVEMRQHVTQAAGFRTLDLRDAYDGYSQEALQIRPWDNHPNALAHSLIADRLYRELLKKPELLKLELSAAATR